MKVENFRLTSRQRAFLREAGKVKKYKDFLQKQAQLRLSEARFIQMQLERLNNYQRMLGMRYVQDFQDFDQELDNAV